MPHITQLFTYPIKSCKANPAVSLQLETRGFLHDRRMALVNPETKKIMTGRNHPQILKLSVTIADGAYHAQLGPQSIRFEISDFSPRISPVDLWAQEQHPAHFAADFVNQWFSEHLGVDCLLAWMGDDCRRALPENVPSNYRGQPSDLVSYADDFPVLLASESSLADLNARLAEPVTTLHFRPNIVIQGLDAFEEENFTSVRIGTCEFEVAQACPRCVFTTIDPVTGVKSQEQEPLRTLTSYRLRKGYGVPFGLQMVPRKLGVISVGDTVNFE